MIEIAYLETLVATLQTYPGIDRIDAGLTDTEVEGVQNRCQFVFPPDLRRVLQFALPIGKAFPDWRSGSDEELWSRLSWPLEGIRVDVEHADDDEVRLKNVRKAAASVPRLIPVFSHRYIPSEPMDAGNPVFSVYHTDIIYYGNDLASYFHKEFGVALPDWAAREPRLIRLWSDAVNCR